VKAEPKKFLHSKDGLRIDSIELAGRVNAPFEHSAVFEEVHVEYFKGVKELQDDFDFDSIIFDTDQNVATNYFKNCTIKGK